MLVAYQGVPGAFGQAAALGLWPNAEPVGVPTFDDVVSGVRDGRFHGGVIPVENRIVGPVHAGLAALSEARELDRSREIMVPVVLHLLGTRDAEIETLESVLGHPVALAQCRRFLSRLERAAVRHWYDSAAAAQMVGQDGNRRIGAIASSDAASRYGLATIAACVQDRPDNATRFIGISARR